MTNGMPVVGESFAKIKVVGVGGGGSNAVNRMIQSEVRGIEFIAVNTDGQALSRTDADRKIQIGDKLTKGQGAGGDPKIGTKAAEETSDEIYQCLNGADMVFITAGMGGGTGSGAAPVIAQIAQEVGALTVAVVTRPFTVEGTRRRLIAEEAIGSLRDKVDTLIVIPNDRLLQVVDKKATVQQAFKAVDDLLQQGIQGVAELITLPGLINLDFADIKAIMTQAGSALMSIGRGQGDNRAVDAAKQAISSPLLEVSIDGARGVIINFTGGPDMTLHEIHAAAELVQQAADPDANIMFGAVVDPQFQNAEIAVTLIATGFDAKPATQTRGKDNIRVFQPPAPIAPPPAAHAPTPAAPVAARTADPRVEDLDIPSFLRQRR